MTASVDTRKPETVDAALTVEDLVVEFNVGKGQTVHAVSGISFTVAPGETLGVVGESGCGKSTAGRAIMQLPSPTSGSIRLGETEMTALGAEELRRSRTQLQMIFQDPISSLNPRRKVKALITEGPSIWGGKDKAAIEARAREVLAEVGLDPDMVWDRTPRELSGGQCQRVCIARALMLDPKVLICDEPVSSLDVSVQAQILNLLEDAKKRHGLSLLFIAHNMAVVKNISDRVMIMYLGRGLRNRSRRRHAEPRAAPVHAATAGVDSRSRRHRHRGAERRAEGHRTALAAQSAQWLPVPHAVPAGY